MMEVQRVLWHTHGRQRYFHEQHDPFRLAECIDYQLLLRFYFESSCAVFTLIHFTPSSFSWERFPLIRKNDSHQKTIFLDAAVFSLVPLTLDTD